MTALLLSNLTATLFLTGLVWFLQVVHLPLLLRAGSADFAEYAKAQRFRNTALMAGPMAVELITGALLFASPFPQRGVFHAFVLLALAWIVTFAWVVPLNSRLVRGYDENAIRVLIRRNWIRTVCWTARAAIMIWITAGALHIY